MTRSFSKILRDSFVEAMSPNSLIADLIADDLAKQGNKLSKKQFRKLRDTLIVTSSKITAELPDHFAEAKVDPNQITQERIDSLIKAKLKILNERFPAFVDTVAKLIHRQTIAEISGRSTSINQNRVAFESRVYTSWMPAFDLMNVFLSTTMEIGRFVQQTVKRRKPRKNDYLTEILLRLHVRACRVAGEIATLIRSGYADGANARWRTLHEIACVAMLLSEKGNDLAERYVLHAEIRTLKELVEYETHAKALKLRPVSQRRRTQLEKRQDVLKKRFGPEFGGNYGWCAQALGKKKPTFSDIEAAVRVEHYGPYVGLASESVHAGPKAVYFSISLIGDAPMPTIAGPTDFGFTDPAQNMSISLNQVTSCLLNLRSDFDMLVKLKLLHTVQGELVKAFMKCQRQIKREAHSIR